MKERTQTILYTKEVREYVRHMRFWECMRGSQVLLFLCILRINHVTHVRATSWEYQGETPFVHLM